MNKDDVIVDGPKRMQNELVEMMGFKVMKQCQLLETQKDNIYKWYALLMPDKAPYNAGAFKLEIDFPKEFPFRPPQLYINTKIYHPNINEKGLICLPILESEQWKPTSRMAIIISVLLATINDPQPENAYMPDIASQFLNDYSKFYKMADAWVARYSEHRPTDSELARIIKKRKKAMQK